ncbi:MAG: SDR family oxidoreductase [Polyangiales bacterium]
MKLRNKVALLTGAGSGIGRHLAGELARHGARLILTDIDDARLRETIVQQGIEESVLGTIVADFLEPAAPERVIARALEISPRIDVLYNNAGMMVLGQIRNQRWEDFDRQQRVNLFAPVKMTHLLLPTMIAQGGGYIAFTCSASALTTPPGAGSYGLTKAGVAAFSEALRAEVARHRISVTTVCPGFVHTPLAHTATYRDEKTANQTKNVPRFIGSSPQKVARISTRALIKRRGVIVINVDERMKWTIKKLSQWLYTKLNIFLGTLLLDD